MLQLQKNFYFTYFCINLLVINILIHFHHFSLFFQIYVIMLTKMNNQYERRSGLYTFSEKITFPKFRKIFINARGRYTKVIEIENLHFNFYFYTKSLFLRWMPETMDWKSFK